MICMGSWHLHHTKIGCAVMCMSYHSVATRTVPGLKVCSNIRDVHAGQGCSLPPHSEHGLRIRIEVKVGHKEIGMVATLPALMGGRV